MSNRRLRMAVLVLLIALGLITSQPHPAPQPMNTETPSICSSITPDDTFLWWLFDCGKDSAGGGGSGAS
jgi:hypothetical protein